MISNRSWVGLKLGRTVGKQISKRMGRKRMGGRRKTYSVGLKYVVKLVVGFTIKELGHVHGTDKRAIWKCN
jgi:hypothetical protein